MASQDDFWWGTAASSTQAEGAAPHSDWAWLADLDLVPPTPGNGFDDRYSEDFALYASHGLVHHRLSIEWARIEPEQGRRDQRAVEHYRRVLEAAHDAGVSPWVCLLHFTTPRWFGVDLAGFAGDSDRALELFGSHVEFVEETFGELVAGWQPINEPNAFVTAYLAAQHPALAEPGEVDRVLQTVNRAAAEAARTVRPLGRPIATIHNLIPVRPTDDSPEAEAATRRADELIWQSWNRPDLLEPFDLLGFSYYHAAAVDGHGERHPWPPGEPVGEMGYSPWPHGLREVLDRLDAEVDLPLLVAELGIGTNDDNWRQRYLPAALDQLDEARRGGVDVRGCFFWTGVDNDEWLHADTVPFGLFDRDREPRPSLAVISGREGVTPGPGASGPLTRTTDRPCRVGSRICVLPDPDRSPAARVAVIGRTRRVLVLSLGVLLSVAVLASCGGDDGSADDGGTDSAAGADSNTDGDAGAQEESGESTEGAATRLDPCELLTLDDVTAAGIAVVDGPIEDPSTVEGFATCYFADDRQSPGVRVSVATADDTLAGGIADAEEIDGLGSSATYSEIGRFVSVRLDDETIVTVEIAFFLDPEDPRDVLLELAEKAIA